MAVIPLKQKIAVERAGVKDEWGESLRESLTFKCRVDEGAKLVKNRAGAEVVSSAQILLDKIADVRYDDYISYTNELGDTIREQPISISVIRNIAGKPLLTEVAL